MSEQTAEERRKTRACCTRHRPRANGDCADCWCLEATAQQRRRKQAEGQRDGLKEQVQEWMEGSAQLQVKLDEAEGALRAADAELEEWTGWRGHDVPANALGRAVELIRTFLAGLSTVTPDCERVSGVCPKCGFDFSPPCERVTMGCCPKCCEHLGFKCAYHGCPWPDEGECPSWKQWVGDCSEDSVP